MPIQDDEGVFNPNSMPSYESPNQTQQPGEVTSQSTSPAGAEEPGEVSTSSGTQSGGGAAPAQDSESSQFTAQTGVTENTKEKVSWPKLKSLDDDLPIYGLPPIAYEPPDSGEVEKAIKDLIVSQMCIIDVYPALQNAGTIIGGEESQGLQLFKADIQEGEKKWKGILKSLEKYIGDCQNVKLPLRYAVPMSTLTISESWTSSYQDSFLEGMMNTGSKMLREVSRIVGATNTKEFFEKVGRLAGLGEQARGAYENLMAQLSSIAGGEGTGRQTERIASTLGGLLTGGRVDFPSIWEESGFGSQYQFTIRLYNPNTRSFKMFQKYILRPLAFLLALATPIASSPYTYTFPLLVKLRSPGQFYVPAGYISNLTVKKGGDSEDFTYNQQPGTIEVSVTVDSLYSTMVAIDKDESQEGNPDEDPDRPTLVKYFSNLVDHYDHPKLLSEQSPVSASAPAETVPTSVSEAAPPQPEVNVDEVKPREIVPENVQNTAEKITETTTSATETVNKVTTAISDTFSTATTTVDRISGAVSTVSNSITTPSNSPVDYNTFTNSLQISDAINNLISTLNNIQRRDYPVTLRKMDSLNNLLEKMNSDGSLSELLNNTETLTNSFRSLNISNVKSNIENTVERIHSQGESNYNSNVNDLLSQLDNLSNFTKSAKSMISNILSKGKELGTK